MMKSSILFKSFVMVVLLGFSCMSNSSAQKLRRQVVGTLGGSQTQGGTTLSFTAGEAQAGLSQQGNTKLLVGFQQPIQLIVPQRLGIQPALDPRPVLTSELYPNPASDRAFLHFEGEAKHVQVVDMHGNVHFSQALEQSSGMLSLTLDALPEAMYFVILHGTTEKITHKLVISR